MRHCMGTTIASSMAVMKEMASCTVGLDTMTSATQVGMPS